MAKKIDLTKPLSEDDLRYLVDRDRWDDIRTNADNLGIEAPNLPSPRGIRMQVPRQQLRNTDGFDRIAKMMHVQREPEPDEEDAGTPPVDAQSKAVDYNQLTVPQLKEELDTRKAKYESEQDADGVALVSYAADARKGDLVALLQLDDEETSEEDEDK